jgi:hypothetical protein
MAPLNRHRSKDDANDPGIVLFQPNAFASARNFSS